MKISARSNQDSERSSHAREAIDRSRADVFFVERYGPLLLFRANGREQYAPTLLYRADATLCKGDERDEQSQLARARVSSCSIPISLVEAWNRRAPHLAR